MIEFPTVSVYGERFEALTGQEATHAVSTKAQAFLSVLVRTRLCTEAALVYTVRPWLAVCGVTKTNEEIHNNNR